ncbi:MAG: hypothetical protein ACK5ZR_07685 [Gemmatimonadaceae bacterium]
MTLVRPSGSFIFGTLPVLMHALEDGVAMRAVVVTPGDPEEASIDASEQQRRRFEAHAVTMLRIVGVEIVETPNELVPWEGAIFCRSSDRERMAVIGAPAEGAMIDPFSHQEFTRYTDPVDRAVLDALDRDLARLNIAPREVPLGAAAFSFEPCLQSDWRPLIQRVHAYNGSGVTLSVGDVRLADLQAVDQYIKEYRIPGARRMIKAFADRGLPWFEPMRLKLASGEWSLVLSRPQNSA